MRQMLPAACARCATLGGIGSTLSLSQGYGSPHRGCALAQIGTVPSCPRRPQAGRRQAPSRCTVRPDAQIAWEWRCLLNSASRHCRPSIACTYPGQLSPALCAVGWQKISMRLSAPLRRKINSAKTSPHVGRGSYSSWSLDAFTASLWRRGVASSQISLTNFEYRRTVETCEGQCLAKEIAL